MGNCMFHYGKVKDSRVMKAEAVESPFHSCLQIEEEEEKDIACLFGRFFSVVNNSLSVLCQNSSRCDKRDLFSCTTQLGSKRSDARVGFCISFSHSQYILLDQNGV